MTPTADELRAMSDEEIENFFDATLDEVLASMPEDWQLLLHDRLFPPTEDGDQAGIIL